MRLISILGSRPLHFRIMTVIDILFTDVQYILNLASLVALCFVIPYHPVVFVRLMITILGASLLNSLYFVYLEFSWDGVWKSMSGVLYDVLAFFCLWWILPYAVLTMREQRWGTR